MQQRHPRSGASGSARASKTLSGPAKGSIPWPSAARRSVPPPPAPTRKQAFGLAQEEDAPTRIHVRSSHDDALFPEQVEPVTPVPAHRPRAGAKRVHTDPTQSWAPVDARPNPNLWDEPCLEQSATANVTQGQLEELRRHLQLEQEKFAHASGPRAGIDNTPLLGQQHLPLSLPSRRRPLVKWLASIAILTVLGLGVVAHQTGYRPPVDVPQWDMSSLKLSSLKLPQFDLSGLDLSRLQLPQIDVRPLQSAMSKAQAGLRAGYDALLAAKPASLPAPAPMPPSAVAPASATETLPPEPPTPTVVQLQEGDLEEQVDEALLPTSTSESSAESTLSAASDLSAMMDESSEHEASEPASAEQEMPAVEKPVVKMKKNARSAMRAARAPRAQGKGVLRINSLPWAEIYVDGELVGNTPSMNLELAAGRHRIGLRNKDHGLTNSFVVDIKPGGVETRIVNLKDPSKN